jgi:DNA-binding NarL/FixJ family response regulator
MIRTVIVDDHPVFRRGLAGVLDETDDIEVVGEAVDGSAVVDLVQRTDAQVVLMDLHMDGTGGVEATARLRSCCPDVAVLVLTMSVDAESLHAALGAGARGYLVKGATGDRIVGAVRAVAAGDTVFGSDVADRLLNRLTQGTSRRSRAAFPALTEREEEVLDLIARGWSNAEISRHLVVSEKTVRNHVSNVFAKLDVPNRARAIVVAREAGLGSHPPTSAR